MAAPAEIATGSAIGGGIGYTLGSFADWVFNESADTDGDEPRFIGDSNGEVVDTEATPPGSYDQPDGGRTDILQDQDHGAGRTHTHNPIVNTDPATGKSFVNGKVAGPVSAQDVENIKNGDAPRSEGKKR